MPLAGRRITSMQPRMGGEGGGNVHSGCVPPRGRDRKWAWPEVAPAGSGRGHGVVAMLPLASRRITSMRPRMGGKGGGYVHGGCVPPRGRGRKRAWPEVGVAGSGRGLTRMQADADAHGDLRHVAHLEGADGAEDVQRHVGDLPGVPVAVALRQPRSHHVGVPDGLHLRGEGAPPVDGGLRTTGSRRDIRWAAARGGHITSLGLLRTVRTIWGGQIPLLVLL